MRIDDATQIIFTTLVIIWILKTSKGKLDKRTKGLIWIINVLLITGNFAAYFLTTENSKWALAYDFSFTFIQFVILWSFARNF
ncbi:hypothetical protein ACPD8N_05150 [Lacticaseibacillus chiayiensis]|uniref:hypothetical protein n=1 Tax=Lacticaseibacillus chiayiensis TaxID=2100821 RepID=UPI003C7720B6